jgi:hypothetical protein
MPEYLNYLAGGGAIAIVAIIISVVAEKFDFWHKLDSLLKIIIQIVLSTAIAVGATFLIKNPELYSGIEDYLLVATNIIIAIATNQGWHTKSKQLE